MTRRAKPAAPIAPTEFARCRSGIPGLDLITNGGLPRGRTTLVFGGPGAGKTLFGILRGAGPPGEDSAVWVNIGR